MKKSIGLVAAFGIVAAMLSGCATTSQTTAFVKGSSLTIGESGQLTSLNAQVLATPGSATTAQDLAQLTLPAFYSHDAKGALNANTDFGTVTRTADNSVTYKLTGKAKWSDGVVVSPADLAVSWLAATQTKQFTLQDGTVLNGFNSRLRLTSLALADKLTVLGNGVTLHFSQPIPDWQTALPLSVPAHQLVKLALPNSGLSDADAAQKLLDLATGKSSNDLIFVAKAFAQGFNLPTDGSALDPKLLVTAGAYGIKSASASSVTLKANPDYSVGPKPSVDKVTVAAYSSPDDLAQALAAKKVDLAMPVPSTMNSLATLQAQAKSAGLQTGVGDSGQNEVVLLNYAAGSAFNAGTWNSDSAKVNAAREGFFKFLPRAGIWSEFAGDSSLTKSDSLVFGVGTSDYQSSVGQNGTTNYEFQDAESSAEAWQAAKFDRTVKLRVVFDANSARGQLEYSQLARLGKLGGFDVENDSSENPDSVLAGGQWDVYIADLDRLEGSNEALATTVGSLTGFSVAPVTSVVNKVAAGDSLSGNKPAAKNLDQLLVQNHYGLPLFQVQRLLVWSGKLASYQAVTTNDSLVWGYSNWSVSGKGK